MTKTTKYHLLCTGVGALIGLTLGVLIRPEPEATHPLTTANNSNSVVASIPTEPMQEAFVPGDLLHASDNWRLLQTAFLTVHALESQDYTTLSHMIHKDKGIRFTPYSTVNEENDLVFTAEEIKNISQDNSLYTWGVSANTGGNISLTLTDFFQEYVTPISYSKAPYIAIDSVIITGNALENIPEAYPDSRFVDFSFRSIDPDLAGKDWSSLKLVFEIYEDAWYLVGIVHSQWTV